MVVGWGFYLLGFLVSGLNCLKKNVTYLDIVAPSSLSSSSLAQLYLTNEKSPEVIYAQWTQLMSI
jgi:hypothetical protein